VTQDKAKTDKKIDKAGGMTFPASDPAATGKATGTEPPTRPTDRKAPVITRDDVDRAQKGEGHKKRDG
jgi:hypothetical protein